MGLGFHPNDIDYHDTFALIAELVIVSCLFDIVSIKQWSLHS